jgi:hypothetical protein
MRRIFLFAMVTAVVVMTCTRSSEGVVRAEVTRRSADAIEVRVANNSPMNILLMSPASPNREADEKQCMLRLSTKIQEWIRPYAFTPDLIEVKAGSTYTVSVGRIPPTPATCTDWRVDLEYSYVEAKAALDARRIHSDDFRQYVLKHQQVAKMASER